MSAKIQTVLFQNIWNNMFQIPWLTGVLQLRIDPLATQQETEVRNSVVNTLGFRLFCDMLR